MYSHFKHPLYTTTITLVPALINHQPRFKHRRKTLRRKGECWHDTKDRNVEAAKSILTTDLQIYVDSSNTHQGWRQNIYQFRDNAEGVLRAGQGRAGQGSSLYVAFAWLKLVKGLPQWGQEVQSQHDSGDWEVETERITLTTSTVFNSSVSGFCQTIPGFVITNDK